ncbi:MAG: NAD(P)H-dependent oxidoreductase [Spirochaetes bacterium]|nr:NAD(P)H-dependent oxidoreductase [Spirochaetota bacterium]MBN2771076.1 NAD(P)H-dependent oxidoreductase [Spirochaetota bacterium]
MSHILITYYSNSGNTEAMAGSIAEGAQSYSDMQVVTKNVKHISNSDLQNADAIIVGSPTYYGTMAAEVKTMFDNSIELHGALDGKIGAAFASSGGVGGGNETTVLDILKALLIHGMIIQGSPEGDHYGPVSIGKPDERVVQNCLQLGRRVTELVKKIKQSGMSA